MKQASVIKLTKNKECILDFDDFLKFGKLKWCANEKGNHFYAYRHVKKPIKRGFYLHRLIMNATEGQYVDHINGNTLDNRKENLRICTNRENSQNSPGQPKQRIYSKFKGIKKNTNCSTWSARITINSKSIYLGSFKTEIEAAKAYNEAAIKYFGEFARLNEV